MNTQNRSGNSGCEPKNTPVQFERGYFLVRNRTGGPRLCLSASAGKALHVLAYLCGERAVARRFAPGCSSFSRKEEQEDARLARQNQAIISECFKKGLGQRGVSLLPSQGDKRGLVRGGLARPQPAPTPSLFPLASQLSPASQPSQQTSPTQPATQPAS